MPLTYHHYTTRVKWYESFANHRIFAFIIVMLVTVASVIIVGTVYMGLIH